MNKKHRNEQKQPEQGEQQRQKTPQKHAENTLRRGEKNKTAKTRKLNDCQRRRSPELIFAHEEAPILVYREKERREHVENKKPHIHIHRYIHTHRI